MENDSNKVSKCPVTGAAHLHSAATGGAKNLNWCFNQLKMNILCQHSFLSSPMGEDFNYSKELKSMDLKVMNLDRFDLA